MSISLSYTTSKNKIESIDLEESVEKVDLTSRNIAQIDLSPLENLPELRHLGLGENRLEEIDLSPLRKCRKLSYLRISNCGPITSLDLTPLSECSELVDLRFTWLKEIRSVDLSPLANCRNLKILRIGIGSEFETLDIAPLAKCIALENISLPDVTSGKLDLTPLSNCLNLREMEIWCEHLTALDLAPLSNHSHLEKLALVSDHLAELDITPLFSCVGLTKLYFATDSRVGLRAKKECKEAPHPAALEGFRHRIAYGVDNIRLVYEVGGVYRADRKQESFICPADVKELSFRQKHIKSFDFSQLGQLSNLSKIDFQENLLEEVDFSFCSHLKNLEHVDISKNEIGSLDMSPLIDCTSLEFFDAGGNRLTQLDLNALRNCKNLKVLSVGAEGARLDLSQLPKSIEKLRIHGRKVQIDRIPSGRLTNLEELSFEGVAIDSLDLSPLSESRGLKYISIKHGDAATLDLRFCTGLVNLHSLLLCNHSIQRIDLDPLENCVNLTLLDLHSNRLESLDLSPLRSLPHLATLDFSRNALKELDLSPLSTCQELKELALDYNHLTSIDLKPLRDRTTLTSLNLTKNRFLSIDITPILHHDTTRYELDVGVVLVNSSYVEKREKWAPRFKDRRSIRIIHYDDTDRIISISISEVKYRDFREEYQVHLPHSTKEIHFREFYSPSSYATHSIDLKQLAGFDSLEVLILGSSRRTWTGSWYGSKQKKRPRHKSKRSSKYPTGLIELDLEPLRSCSKLKEVDIGNLNLGSIDLSALGALSDLETVCLDGNGLSSIDLMPLRNCTKLREVHLEDNLLSSLALGPLSFCSNLESISLNENNLVELDLTPLTSCSQLKELNLLDNLFASIDLTPLLSIPEFKALQYEKIAVIVTDNKSFVRPAWLSPKADLRLETEFVQLPVTLGNGSKQKLSLPPSVVNLSSRGITAVDLSPLRKAKSLTHLILDENSLEQVDLSPLLHCGQLTHLSIARNKLTAIDLSPLAGCQKLEVLNIGWNCLDSIDISPLRNLENIQEMHFNQNRVSAIDLHALIGNPSASLKVLNIDNSRLTEVDVTPAIGFRTDCIVKIGKARPIATVRDVRETWPKSMRRLHERIEQLPFRETINTRGWQTFLSILEMSWLTLTLGGKYSWLNYISTVELLQGFEIPWMIGVDITVPDLLKDIPVTASYQEARDIIEDALIKRLETQIKKNGPTLFLDTKKMSGTKVSYLIPSINSRRLQEIKETTVPIEAGRAYVKYLWITYHGFFVLRDLGVASRVIEKEYLQEARKALKKIGVDLMTTGGTSAEYAVKMSKDMQDFVLKVAEKSKKMPAWLLSTFKNIKT